MLALYWYWHAVTHVGMKATSALKRNDSFTAPEPVPALCWVAENQSQDFPVTWGKISSGGSQDVAQSIATHTCPYREEKKKDDWKLIFPPLEDNENCRLNDECRTLPNGSYHFKNILWRTPVNRGLSYAFERSPSVPHLATKPFLTVLPWKIHTGQSYISQEASGVHFSPASRICTPFHVISI